MVIILFGAPGTGKGTLAQRLQAQGMGKQISTGDLFRKEMDEGSELGKKVKQIIDSGKLVNDKDTIELLSKHLEKNTILDGYPRTVKQVSDLDCLLGEKNLQLNLVVNLLADESVLIDRIVNRRICSKCRAIYNVKFAPTKKEGICNKCGGVVIQREDDKEQLVRTRFQEYNNKTTPILEIYRKRGLVFDVDSEEAFSNVEIIEQIKNKLR